MSAREKLHQTYLAKQALRAGLKPPAPAKPEPKSWREARKQELDLLIDGTPFFWDRFREDGNFRKEVLPRVEEWRELQAHFEQEAEAAAMRSGRPPGPAPLPENATAADALAALKAGQITREDLLRFEPEIEQLREIERLDQEIQAREHAKETIAAGESK